MRITPSEIYSQKKARKKVTVLTAFDYSLARILDHAGIDIVLVGDSLGMVALGHGSTRPVTMADMLHHTRAVSRAVSRALVVADMPHGSYRTSPDAVRNARRLTVQGGADAVKLEGGAEIERQITAILSAGIPVMGHLGLLPQSVETAADYRVKGQTKTEADRMLADARLLDGLGVFAMVLECIPSPLAAKISKAVKCPTIGIGAGASADGQVLVTADMLGMQSEVRPRFVRRYAELENTIEKAVKKYCGDVAEGRYPSSSESYGARKK